MKIFNIIFFSVLVSLFCSGQTQKPFLSQTDFRPAQVWSDTNGVPINAHGGGVIFFKGIYYWYGEHKMEGKSEATFADGGIHCYSSSDLVNWKDEGLVLSVDYKDKNSDLAYGCILERPKVVYNEKNKQFVAFFKLYLKGVGYETSNVGVAVADQPTGPFRYHHKFHGGGSPNGSGDFSMFKDDNGSLYHLTVRKPDKAFVIGKLDSDYYYPEGDYSICEGITLHTEAPVVFKRAGVYHLLGSGSSGWKPNAARYFTSDSLLGKWTYHGNPCLGFNGVDSVGVERTFGAQSSYIIPVQGMKDAYIAMFDIWKPENPVAGRYIWLPVEFQQDKISIAWRNNWNLSVYEDNHENLIAASQAGASPLFFDPANFASAVIQTQNFSDPNEFKVRDGLPNFFNKIKKGKDVTIGYLGGSITRADNQYRCQATKFIQSRFPAVKVTGINAGVSGTGSDLGACRLHDQLLKYNPDLIFVEFAVNGAYQEGVEGIIRQIRKYNPLIDICLIYTISTGQTKIYAAGNVPENIRNLEKIADYYAIPSVHMGLQASILEKQGKLIWKSDSTTFKNQIVFSGDGTHPLEAGGNLYAEAIGRALLKMENNAEDKNYKLSTPILTDNWEDAVMLDPKSSATFSPGWEIVNPKAIESLNQFSGWFPYVMKAEKPGAWLKFSFNGTMLGIFDIGGPEVGQIELEIDGVPVHFEEKSSINYVVTDRITDLTAINRFNHYCNNRYRGQCVFIKTKPGNHTVLLKISVEIPDKAKILGNSQLSDITMNPAKYNHSAIYIGKILLRGTLQKPPTKIKSLSKKASALNLFSHFNTASDLGEMCGMRADLNAGASGYNLSLEVTNTANYAWATFPAPKNSWNFNKYARVEADISNRGDSPVEVTLWTVGDLGREAVGDFQTLSPGEMRKFSCNLRETFPDGTPKIDPGHIRQIQVMISKAVKGSKLQVDNLVVTGKVSPWKRPAGWLKVPKIMDGPPAAGHLVRYRLKGDENNGIYCLVYLPSNWKKSKSLPVIMEYPGNIYYAKACYSNGLPDQCVIGYGMTRGKDAIWVSLPFIDRKKGEMVENGWGDPEATADYAVSMVEEICSKYNGDKKNIVLTGFSRGAIACGFIGLRNDRIAPLWKAFHACQHYDGDGWNGATMEGAKERARRFAGQAVFQTDNSEEFFQPVMDEMKTKTTYVSSGLGFHSCAMFLDDRPSTQQLRKWFKDLVKTN
ncbi:MAG: family 43 glycosylhydrolase [Prolixibacteraceae bacterium]